MSTFSKLKSISIIISVMFILQTIMTVIPDQGLGNNTAAENGNSGYQDNIAWKPMKPMKSITMVGNDPLAYTDDYAYLASVPAGVFRENDKLYSSPVLFYEPPYEGDEKEMTLNGNQGLGYFLEDWKTVNNGEFDNIRFVNMPEKVEGTDIDMNGTNSPANRINEENIFTLSSKIALSNWESSNKAVVAVVDDRFSFKEKDFTGSIEGTVPSGEMATQHFQGTKDPDPQSPTFHNFTTDEGYRFMKAEMTWETVPNAGDLTDRGRDLDLQLYDWELGEVAASENWNVLTGPVEDCESFIYNSGEWGAAVTYMPTENMNPGENPYVSDEQLLEMFSMPEHYKVPNTGDGKDTSRENQGYSQKQNPNEIPMDDQNTGRYEIDIEMYPGVKESLDIECPFMARDGIFTLDWEEDVNLGLIITGPSGAVISTATGDSKPKEINIPELGEGQYSAAVVSLDDTNPDTEFTLDYSWKQKYPKKLATSFESAANGAVIASMENAPLLYAEKSSVSSQVKDALDKLGVTEVILAGTRGTGDVKEELTDYRGIFKQGIEVENLDNGKEVFSYIRDNTGENDIIFSTVNSFNEWYIGGFGNPIGNEHPADLSVGPAALAGAFHGAPVLITDAHPGLSASQAWHNEFWRVAYGGRLPPNVGSMALTGHQVYDYLKKAGLDDSDEMESVLTVAGQFDIGTSWDRGLVGAAKPGRICGTPVDTSYWVSRSGLYPLMIFANPSVTGEVTMTSGYDIEKGEAEHTVTADNVFLQTWVSYQHRFNERACGPNPVNNYWACDYTTADGITPYHDESPEKIDNGVNQYGDNANGQYWPDLTISEIIPYYAEKLGYNSVYSTTFPTTMDNLNQGAVLWFEVMHGGNRDGGVVGWWQPGVHGDDEIAGEPWRGYETNGNTIEPDSVYMDKNYGLDAPYNNNPTEYGWHDGIIIAIAEQYNTMDPFGEYGSDGRDWDAEMENIHSVGFAGGSCLIANTYLHLSLIRHGSVFQIIDPWLTSWYCAFALETFLRDIALGDTTGEAYEKEIRHVGIQYMTNSWWWDIFENVIYYGDPDLRIYSPEQSWEQPTFSEKSTINGHSTLTAKEHPNEIEERTGMKVGVYGLFVLIALLGLTAFIRTRKKNEEAEEMKNDSVDWD